jgi:hypothetical protein
MTFPPLLLQLLRPAAASAAAEAIVCTWSLQTIATLALLPLPAVLLLQVQVLQRHGDVASKNRGAATMCGHVYLQYQGVALQARTLTCAQL